MATINSQRPFQAKLYLTRVFSGASALTDTPQTHALGGDQAP